MAFGIGGLGKLIGGAGVANPVGLGIGALSTIGQGIAGLFQAGKAKKMLKQLQDPGYRIPKGFYKNLAQAEQLAKVGMPMEQYNLAKQGIDRAVSTGMRGLSRSANPSAGVASAVRAGTEGVLNLEAQNAAVRRQNIMQAMGARRELAGQELAKQQYAQQQYMNKVNQANALRGAGMQNVFGAASGLANMGLMGSAYGSAGATKTMGEKLGLSELAGAQSSPLVNTMGQSGFYDTLSRGGQLQRIGNIGGISTPRTLPAYNIGG